MTAGLTRVQPLLLTHKLHDRRSHPPPTPPPPTPPIKTRSLGYTKKSFTDQGVGMLTQVGACTCHPCVR
jgi:hypothetical protein